MYDDKDKDKNGSKYEGDVFETTMTPHSSREPGGGLERDRTNGRFVNADAEPVEGHSVDQKRPSGHFASRERRPVGFRRGRRGEEDDEALWLFGGDR